MIEILLAHMVGDYLLQNDWMAQNKTVMTLKGNIACVVHCVLYTLPFALITHYWAALAIIFSTHYFIDRFRLAVYWIKLMNWNWDSRNFGYEEHKPKFMSVWLMIIVDNVLHNLINYFTIYYSK